MEDGVGQIALPPRRVGREPAAVGCGGVVAAVERVAVGRDDLRLEGLVRPCEGHFSRCGPDEIVPLRHLLHLAGAQVFDEKDICVALESGGRGFRYGGGAGRRGRGNVRSAAQHGPGQPVACQRQGAAQREEQGAEEQKGFFHGAYLPPGQTFGLSIPASVGKKAHKRGMPCISAQNALSYTYDNSPEKGIEI